MASMFTVHGRLVSIFVGNPNVQVDVRHLMDLYQPPRRSCLVSHTQLISRFTKGLSTDQMSTVSSETRQVTKQTLSEGISFYTTKIDNPLCFIYEVECDAYKTVTIELDFAGSQNVKEETTAKSTAIVIKKTIGPFSKEMIARIVIADDSKQATLKTSKKWTIDDPPNDARCDYLNLCELEIQRQLGLAAKFCINDLKPRLEEIVQKCQTNSILYIDCSFPPQESSLFASSSGIVATDTKICWRRPRFEVVTTFDS